MNYTNRPIAAYTMAEFESLTSDNANFARGKDKKKRKSRAGLYAGIGAGATALGGLAARYGGSAIDYRRAGKADSQASQMKMDARRSQANEGKRGMFAPRSQADQMRVDEAFKSGGAKGKMSRDIKRAKSAFETIVGNAQSYGAAERGSATGMKGFGKAAMGGLKGISATGAGRVGLGLAAAGTAAGVAGAGYGIYKAMKKGKKK